MKNLIIFFMLSFMSITCAQDEGTYTLINRQQLTIDSLKNSNDSLRARIVQLEAVAATTLDTTIFIELKNLAVGDTLLLYNASANMHITSITRMGVARLGVDEAYFNIYFGNTLFSGGTSLNSQTYLAPASTTYDYYLTTNNAVTKNQYVWVVCTSIVMTDPEIPSPAQVTFQLNFTRD